MNTHYNSIPDNSDIVLSRLSDASDRVRELVIPPDIPGGDMPGDKLKINEELIARAGILFPLIADMMREPVMHNDYGRVVISLAGGSGAGKSVIASIIAYMFNSIDIGCYIMSGDNYPHRIPSENDAERLRIYEEGGMEALDAYLGSPDEVDFDEVNGILRAFRDGADRLTLKRMGRDEASIRHEEVDMSSVQVMILEWTHANSDCLTQADIPILLHSTPEETLKYRRLRGRDADTDSPFTALVLKLEQDKLTAQAAKAKIILTRSGEVIDYDRLKAMTDMSETEAHNEC